MDYLPGGHIERTMCDILQDMRDANKYRNYSNLYYLIEEAQSAANKMENKLGNRKNYYELCKILKEKLKEIRDKEE